MGFIGTNLTNQLLSLGYHVISIDNFFSSKRKIINHNNFTFIEHDVINKIPTIDCDFIFHLACPASPKQYLKDTIYTLDVNYIGTKNVLDFAKNKKIPILFSSTSEIYGDPLIPVQHEKYFGNVYPPSERSSYDEGKRVAETLVYNYHIKYDMSVQITRHFNTYGPYMDSEDGRVISNFIIQGLTDKKMTIYGDGSQTRSFCYIDDCVNALIKFLGNYKIYHGPINIGNTNEMRIIEIADFISETLKIDKNYIFKDLPKNDPKIRKPDISKIKSIPVIDASNTIKILHQNHHYPQKKSGSYKIEYDENLRKAGDLLGSLRNSDFVMDNSFLLKKPNIFYQFFDYLNRFRLVQILLNIIRRLRSFRSKNAKR